MLGMSYTLFGVIIITVAVIKSDDVTGVDPNSPANMQACNSLNLYNKAFIQAWTQKQTIVNSTFKTCTQGAIIWVGDFANNLTAFDPTTMNT